jgi:hypothetical protein
MIGAATKGVRFNVMVGADNRQRWQTGEPAMQIDAVDMDQSKLGTRQCLTKLLLKSRTLVLIEAVRATSDHAS